MDRNAAMLLCENTADYINKVCKPTVKYNIVRSTSTVLKKDGNIKMSWGLSFKIDKSIQGLKKKLAERFGDKLVEE